MKKNSSKGLLLFLLYLAMGFGVAFLLFNSGLLSRGDRENDSVEVMPADSLAEEDVFSQVADSTIYGVSDGFGMSTFVMLDSVGNYYEVMRMADDGTYGEIYGSLAEGQKYAMTVCQGGEVLETLYNLTQLEKFVDEHHLLNGVLYLKNGSAWEAVEVTSLDDNGFTAVGKNGNEYNYKTPKK